MMATTRVSDCLERTILPALFNRVVACRLDSQTPRQGLPRTYKDSTFVALWSRSQPRFFISTTDSHRLSKRSDAALPDTAGARRHFA
jgi:hypothetical protein